MFKVCNSNVREGRSLNQYQLSPINHVLFETFLKSKTNNFEVLSISLRIASWASFQKLCAFFKGISLFCMCFHLYKLISLIFRFSLIELGALMYDFYSICMSFIATVCFEFGFALDVGVGLVPAKHFYKPNMCHVQLVPVSSQESR